MTAVRQFIKRHLIAFTALFFAVGGVTYAGAALNGKATSGGSTQRGLYHVEAFLPDSFGDEVVSFPKPLSATPRIHFIAETASPPAACPGTALHPKAKPGNLCVYEADGENHATASPVASQYGDARDKLGFRLEVQPASSSQYMMSDGTWAVTPPVHH